MTRQRKGSWGFGRARTRCLQVVEIRRTSNDDAAGIARVRAESSRGAYRGVVPGDYLDAIDVAEWAQRQRRNIESQSAGIVSLVADDGDLIVGWVATGPNWMTDLPCARELCAIYLRPSHWRRGIGKHLMTAAAQSLIERGVSSMILRVLTENRPARRFYESLGGSLVSEHTYTIGGVALPEIAYGWPDLPDLTARAGVSE